MKTVSWEEFKTISTNRKLDILMVTQNQSYELFCTEGGLTLTTILEHDHSSESFNDFETNYLSKCNLARRDSDSCEMVRVKYCQQGWNFLSKTFEIETAKLGSLWTDNYSGPCTSVTAKFFNAANEEITTQEDADLYCTLTEIYFYPAWSYELLGGRVRQQEVPTQPVRVFVRAVPDFSSVQGGSKDFLTNLNLQFIGARSEVMTDGRASKTLTYTAGQPTNKLSFHIKHPAGFKHKIQFSLELFKQ